jgi:hypothetical protein
VRYYDTAPWYGRGQSEHRTGLSSICAPVPVLTSSVSSFFPHTGLQAPYIVANVASVAWSVLYTCVRIAACAGCSIHTPPPPPTRRAFMSLPSTIVRVCYLAGRALYDLEPREELVLSTKVGRILTKPVNRNLTYENAPAPQYGALAGR